MYASYGIYLLYHILGVFVCTILYEYIDTKNTID